MQGRRPSKPRSDDSFGARLAHYRRAAGFTQRSFAKSLGLSPRMVAYWEAQAPRPPPADLLAVMAEAVGVRADDLLALSETSRRPVNRRWAPYVALLEKLPVRTQKEVQLMLHGLAHAHGIELEESGGDAEATHETRAPRTFLRVRRGPYAKTKKKPAPSTRSRG